MIALQFLNNMSELEDVKQSVRDLSQEYDVVAAYLFGSFARQEQDERSDIDIAVIFEDYDIQKLLEFGRKLEERSSTGREIDVRPLNSASVVFGFQVLKDGEVIYESSKSKRADFEQYIERKYHDMKPKIEEFRKFRSERLKSYG